MINKQNCEKLIMKHVVHGMTSVVEDYIKKCEHITFGIENGHKETLFFRWPNFLLKCSFH